jgi:hypothetical protein
MASIPREHTSKTDSGHAHFVVLAAPAWVSGSSRVKTYGSVEHVLFQALADWYFYQ